MSPGIYCLSCAGCGFRCWSRVRERVVRRMTAHALERCWEARRAEH